MPTPGERIATLEEQSRDFTRRIEALEDQYNGGGDTDYNRSVRGRLHNLEGTMAAMGVVTKQRVRILRGWQAVTLSLCAVVTAACAIVTALHVVLG